MISFLPIPPLSSTGRESHRLEPLDGDHDRDLSKDMLGKGNYEYALPFYGREGHC